MREGPVPKCHAVAGRVVTLHGLQQRGVLVSGTTAFRKRSTSSHFSSRYRVMSTIGSPSLPSHALIGGESSK